MNDLDKKISEFVSDVENSIKEDLNLESNLSFYIEQVKRMLDEIKFCEVSSDIYINRFYTLIYKLIKYSIIFYKDDVSVLIDMVKSNDDMNKFISKMVEEDISFVSNSSYLRPDILDQVMLEEIIHSKAGNYLLVDQDIIRFVCGINMDLRDDIVDDLSYYAGYLSERNENIVSKINKLKVLEDLRNGYLSDNRKISKEVKKQFISLMLSLSLTVSTFFVTNFITRECMNNSKRMNSVSEEEYVLLIKDEEFVRLKNIVSILFSSIVSILFANLPKSGIKNSYIKYRSLQKELMGNVGNIKDLWFVIEEAKSELDYITSLDEETINKVKRLFRELHFVVGYYYVDMEERAFCDYAEGVARDSFVLRNRVIDSF